jgi:hypothetical protein
VVRGDHFHGGTAFSLLVVLIAFALSLRHRVDATTVSRRVNGS